MTDFEKKLATNEFVGIVEDNLDPNKKQRVRIRIPYLHGDETHIPTDAIPWAQPIRDNNGLSFSIPDIGKVVNVTFPTGNLYFPVYKNAEHLNINLQNKIESYDGENYASFIALCYNHNCQIFIDNESMNMFYKFNGMKVTEDNITIIKKDRNSSIKLGNDDADEPIILGDKFFKWLDAFVDALPKLFLSSSPGAVCVASPDLINLIGQFKSNRSSFLSSSIYAINNDNTTKHNFDLIGQIGDKITYVSPENSSSNSKFNVITEPLPELTAIPVNMPKTTAIPDLNNDIETTINPSQKNTNIPNFFGDEDDESGDTIISDEESFDFSFDANESYVDSDGFDFDFDGFDIEGDELADELAAAVDVTTNVTTNVTTSDSNRLQFNFDKKQFNFVDKKIKYDNTYRLIIDANKLPHPTLTKKKLINWKLAAEGGHSNAITDSASKNPNNICPTPYKGMINIHTNKGVTYSVWKSIFGKDKDKRFLNMSHDDWSTVFEKLYWNKHAKLKYKESVNCLLVSFAWGGSKDICVEKANLLLNGKFDQASEKQQVAALLSARGQFFINISQPGKKNNVYRSGWINNAVNKLLKVTYD